MNEHMEVEDQENTLQDMGEVANLNFADLDVQELEKRLELAMAAAPDQVTCGYHMGGNYGYDVYSPEQH